MKKATRNILYANIDVHRRMIIDEFLGDGVKCIEKLQSNCANMNFADKSRYDRIFQQVKHKGGESKINYINIFQTAQALSVSVGKNYSEEKLMCIFLDNFHQDEKYFARIAIHQAELRREEDFTEKKFIYFILIG